MSPREKWALGLLVLFFVTRKALAAPPPPFPFPAPVPPPPMPGGKVLTIEDLRALASSVGFPDPDTAAAVAMAESSGNPAATNIVTKPAAGNLPERSFGLWQINTLAHPEFEESRLLDPVYNANAALLVSRQGVDWKPWSVFTTTDPARSYKRFMPAGRA